MKRPPVFLQSGGSCLSTIVLTISLNALLALFYGFGNDHVVLFL